MTVVDEYKILAAAVSDTGEVRAFHLASGNAIEAPDFDFGGKRGQLIFQSLQVPGLPLDDRLELLPFRKTVKPLQPS